MRLSMRISLASPEQIRSWSYGEVTKPKTINDRTLKADRDGLFSEVIFGPTKDFECACGKYKSARYRGIICDKCGVEVAKAKVRRERIGHIELAAPVTHIWFLKGTPSYLGLLLNMPSRKLEELGAEAISEMLKSLDLDKLRDEVLKEIDLTSNKWSKKAVQRLRAVDGFRRSESKPEATIMTVLPVLPADLRPEKADVLNACYLPVIRHNNRLRRLLDIEAPAVDIRNTKGRLQKAVDCVIGNLLDNMFATCSGYFPPSQIVYYSNTQPPQRFTVLTERRQLPRRLPEPPDWFRALVKRLQSLALAVEIPLEGEEEPPGLELPW